MATTPPLWERAPEDGAGRLDGELVRQRLIDRIAERWSVPVVVVEAPGGFGKSVALSQSMRDNLGDPTGLDVHVPCRPPERDASRLAGRILELLEVPTPTLGGGPDELASVVVDALAHWSPTPVCVVLDDLHHLDDSDDAVALLAAVMRALPTNAHLVLAGRRIPALPLTRLRAADQLVEIGPDDLAFDRSELDALAGRLGADPAVLDTTVGWPALSRLALVVGATAPIDYLMEEVVHGLAPHMRAALAAAVLGRRVDDAMLRAVTGADVGTRDLLTAVPLVTLDGQGAAVAHDLWSEVLTRLLEPDDLRALAVAVSGWHLAGGRHEEAIDAAAAVAAWDAARAAVLGAFGQGDAELSTARTARWLARFPDEQLDEPELLLLRGATRRMAGDATGCHEDLDAAIAEFTARDHLDGRVAAELESGIAAWEAGDLTRIIDQVGRADALATRGVDAVRWTSALAAAGFADLSGDAAGALAHLDTVDVDTMPEPMVRLMWRWMTFMCMLVGDTGRSVEIAEQLFEREPTEPIRLIVGTARWFHGDPEPFRGDVATDPIARFDNARDDIQAATVKAVIDASVGTAMDVTPLAAIQGDRPRDRTRYQLALAASQVAAGDEAGARRVVDGLADDPGVDDPQCWGELVRFASLVYPLSERVAVALDARDLGPTPNRRRELARLLVAVRRGDPVDWSTMPAPPQVLTGLPLRWSLELAAAAAAAGRPEGIELAEYLVDYVGPPALDLLRDGVGAAAPGVDVLLAAIPARPTAPVSITVCGPLAVHGVGDAVDELRRARVRELLALLVLRTEVDADEAVGLLWPGLDPANGRSNLRTTLRYLRRLLEPDRRGGQPSFHVRRHGDRIRLEPSEWLAVDVRDIRQRLRRGRELERRGWLAESITELAAAVDQWSDETFVDLRHHPDLTAEIIHLDLELEDAAARVAEWALAQGDRDRAEQVAERLLAHDPFAERAHAVVIGARLARGDLAAAAAAARRCTSALDELGVGPDPRTAMLLRRLERLGVRPGRS